MYSRRSISNRSPRKRSSAIAWKLRPPTVSAPARRARPGNYCRIRDTPSRTGILSRHIDLFTYPESKKCSKSQQKFERSSRTRISYREQIRRRDFYHDKRFYNLISWNDVLSTFFTINPIDPAVHPMGSV